MIDFENWWSLLEKKLIENWLSYLGKGFCGYMELVLIRVKDIKVKEKGKE